MTNRKYMKTSFEVIAYDDRNTICASNEPTPVLHTLNVGNAGAGTALTADYSSLFD